MTNSGEKPITDILLTTVILEKLTKGIQMWTRGPKQSSTGCQIKSYAGIC